VTVDHSAGSRGKDARAALILIRRWTHKSHLWLWSWSDDELTGSAAQVHRPCIDHWCTRACIYLSIYLSIYLL